MIEVVLADVFELLLRAFSVKVVERNNGALANADSLKDDLTQACFAGG